MKMSDQLDTPAVFTTRKSSGNFQTKLTHNGTRPPSQAFDRPLDTVSNSTFNLLFACKTRITAWVYSESTSLQIHHKDGWDSGRRILFPLMRGQIICWTKKRNEEITETWKPFILHEVLFHKQMWRYKKSQKEK